MVERSKLYEVQISLMGIWVRKIFLGRLFKTFAQCSDANECSKLRFYLKRHYLTTKLFLNSCHKDDKFEEN